MPNTSSRVLADEHRSNWVRLRTLTVLRWLAVAGQLTAILVAGRLFNLDLNLGLCLLAIGISIIANLLSISLFPKNKRLTEREVVSFLVFDITQLSALLFLTGGLHNPFALLLLVPVMISATALRTISTAQVGGVAILFATLVWFYHIPLQTNLGIIMETPKEFVFGFWIAIVIGVVFLAVYAHRVTSEIHNMAEALLATQMALLREQKITDLAGVVAATAHELGTPLATIKLASSELVEELADMPELLEDVILIRDQTNRCRDILRSMGRIGKDDLYMRQAPITAVILEAADPHLDRGKEIRIATAFDDLDEKHQPTIHRSPEIIHGLRNLIQNAVDFASSTVWIDLTWTDERVSVKISDDGPGFPPQVIGRIGDPFVRSHRHSSRPGYQGMGLGLFIAKTLLERSGAELDFENSPEMVLAEPPGPLPNGAIINVSWPIDLIIPDAEDLKFAGGDNQQIPG